MSAILNMDSARQVNIRSAVVLLEGDCGKAGVQIQPGDGICRRLHPMNLHCYLLTQLVEQIIFQHQDAVLCTQNLLLQLL